MFSNGHLHLYYLLITIKEAFMPKAKKRANFNVRLGRVN